MDASQLLACVADLLHSQLTVGVIVEGHFCRFSLPNSDVLSGMGAEKVVLGGNFLNNGIIPGLHIGDDDLAIDRGELPNGIAAGGDHFKNRAVQQLQSARLPFDDPQHAGLRRIFGRRVLGRWIFRRRVVGSALKGDDDIQIHRLSGISVNHIVLNITVLICLRATGVEDGKFMYNSVQGELDAAGLLGHSVLGDEDSELAGKTAAGGFRGENAGNVISALAHNAGAFGDRTGV